ncbi:hypothetical protein DL93DRAFT_2168828 [Clavulina sp. PMI_390]|nr:hypothetical protein DL93DRAFT_2168828 [Clavulina sp. PMI_390]
MPPARRRNGSKKIPNVKLRPAGRAVPASMANHDDAQEELEYDPERDGGAHQPEGQEVDVKAGLLPFRGVEITSTGNIDKVVLRQQIEAMGGILSKHLTDTVKYLIADGPGSAKYSFSVTVGLPIMTPEWVAAAHQRYENGDDFMVEETLDGYRLPCFEGLSICVSGENRMEMRHQIARLISDQGGVYLKDLNDTATHLLIFGDGQSLEDDDIQTAKFNWAVQRNAGLNQLRKIRDDDIRKRRIVDDEEPPNDIHIIWSEWFWDCLTFGGRHPECDYIVQATTRPTPKQIPRPLLEEPSFAEATTSTQHPNRLDAGPIKLPRPHISGAIIDLDPDTDSEDDAQPQRRAPVQLAAPSQAGKDDLWRKVVGGRAGPSTISTTRAHQTKAAISIAPNSPISTESGEPQAATSYLGMLQRSKASTSNMHSHSDADSTSDATRSAPFGRPKAVEKTLSITIPPPSSKAMSSPAPETNSPSTSGLMFTGKSFVICAEISGEQDVLSREILCSKGADILSFPSPRTSTRGKGKQKAITANDILGSADFIIVRSAHALRYTDIISAYPSKVRTESWIELCVVGNEIVPPSAHHATVPVPRSIPDVGNYRIAVSGMENLEAKFLERFCHATGLKTDRTFRRGLHTHLLCPSKNGDKYEHALKWGIPVIDLDWVYGLAYGPNTVDNEPMANEALSDVTNDSPNEADSVVPVAGRKRPLSALVDDESEGRPIPKGDSSRKRDRTSADKPAALEPIPMLDLIPTPRPPSRTSPRKPKPLPETATATITPVTTPKKEQKHQPTGTKMTPTKNPFKRTRSASAVPSSQSPDLLMSPAADRVRKELAEILSAEAEGDDEDVGGELPPVRNMRSHGKTPPAKSRLASVSRADDEEPPSAHGEIRSRSTSAAAAGSGPKKKARPRPVARYKPSLDGEVTRSTSLISLEDDLGSPSISSTKSLPGAHDTRSNSGAPLKPHTSVGDLNLTFNHRPHFGFGDGDDTYHPPSLSQQVRQPKDDSMRVRYDDPKESAERRKLMDMVSSAGSGSVSGGSAKGTGTGGNDSEHSLSRTSSRRSTRTLSS